MTTTTTPAPRDVVLPLDRDVFCRTLIRALAGVLEEVVGHEEAAGYISLVGQSVGDWILSMYREEIGVTKLTREQVAEVLVDLKRRIQGAFEVESASDACIVLTNTACPFAEAVAGRTTMCMMTSNVFGVIAAENLGYAKVCLDRTIAQGDAGCRVLVHLTDSEEARSAEGREYFQRPQRPPQ